MRNKVLRLLRPPLTSRGGHRSFAFEQLWQNFLMWREISIWCAEHLGWILVVWFVSGCINRCIHQWSKASSYSNMLRACRVKTKEAPGSEQFMFFASRIFALEGRTVTKWEKFSCTRHFGIRIAQWNVWTLTVATLKWAYTPAAYTLPFSKVHSWACDTISMTPLKKGRMEVSMTAR